LLRRIHPIWALLRCLVRARIVETTHPGRHPAGWRGWDELATQWRRPGLRTWENRGKWRWVVAVAASPTAIVIPAAVVVTTPTIAVSAVSIIVASAVIVETPPMVIAATVAIEAAASAVSASTTTVLFAADLGFFVLIQDFRREIDALEEHRLMCTLRLHHGHLIVDSACRQ
jgi:hypothetical protein